MISQIRPALVVLGLFTVLTGLVYPLAVTAVAQAFFPHQANGSLVLRDGRPIGSALVGQPFESPEYFWARLSATGPHPYNAGASAGSNLGPSSDALVEAAEARIAALRAADPGNLAPIPVDLVTASGSGLDPHISPAAAAYQVPRVARARGLAEAEVHALVAAHTRGRQLVVLGEPRVDVLALNLALDDLGTGSQRAAELPVRGGLVGAQVVARDGTDVGRVVEALADIGAGRLDYVVVELAVHARRTIMERSAGRLIVVPWSRFRLRTGGEVFVDALPSVLEGAPRLDGALDTSSSGWSEALDAYWSAVPPAAATP